MTGPAKAIFLSYASQDCEAAQRVCEALTAAGLEVWFDQRELRGGDAWDHRIRRQIAACALFIPIISSHTQARAEGYFRLEWDLADQRSHRIAPSRAFIIPLCIDEAPDLGAEVPESFLKVQWTRAPNGAIPAAFVERVSHLLSPEQVHAEPTSRPAPVPSATPGPRLPAANRGTSRQTQGALLLFSAVAVIGVGYLAVDELVLSRRAALAIHGSGPADQSAAPIKTAIPEKSIAVLPFVDMSEKKDQEYFGDGMAEEVLDLLSKLPALTVIGRTSSFQFKGKSEDLRSIAAKLGVGYVVEGSVRRSGNRIRVTAQLTDAAGAHRWSDSYDRDFGDVLALQQQIATAIARALQVAVGADYARPTRRLQSEDAYTFYLRGRLAIDRGDAGIREAESDFEQALTLDPQFARAAEALTLAYLEEIGGGLVSVAIGWPALDDAAARALRLNPDSALVHGLLGLKLATFDYDWAAANAELNRALALKPRDPYALYNLAWLAFDLGRHPEARRLQAESLAIDPLNPDSRQNGAYIDYLMGDLEAAERGFRSSLEISPTFQSSHRMLGVILLLRGEPQAALGEMQAEPAASRDPGLALAYHALGRRVESDAALARAIGNVSRYGEVNIAAVYAYRGERDRALAWLDKAVDAHDIALGHRLKYDPLLASVRGDDRYKALLRKMNLLH